jgi:Golgi phosphoprotein 3 (GPP34)
MSVARIYDPYMAQDAHEALTTAEELLLLAIDPRSGDLRSYPALRLPAAIAGAVLLDLFADGSLTMVDGRVAVCASSANHPYAAVLERIRSLSTPHSLLFWIDAFGYAGSKAKEWTVASLVAKGVIAVNKHPWLPPFPRMRYRLIESAARSSAATKVLDAFRTSGQANPQSAAIAVLAAECGFVRDLVPRSERHGLSGRVRALLQGQAPSRGDALSNGQRPTTLIAQVYAAVYTEGLGPGVVQGT